jgi:hypothetical protein
MSEDGTLFLVISVDVDREHEAAFNEWYNGTHMPAVVACPGFVRGWRLEAAEEGSSPRYAAVYEVEHNSVLDTPELAAIRGFGPFAEHTSNHRRYWFRTIASVGPAADASRG